MKPPTVDYRLRRLREKGIYGGMRYLLDAHALGCFNYLLLVFLRSWGDRLRKALLSFCSDCSAVVYVIENVGTWDFELGIHTSDRRAVVELTLTLSELLGADLNSIVTLPVFGYSKIAGYPFKRYPLQQADPKEQNA